MKFNESDLELLILDQSDCSKIYQAVVEYRLQWEKYLKKESECEVTQRERVQKRVDEWKREIEKEREDEERGWRERRER